MHSEPCLNSFKSVSLSRPAEFHNISEWHITPKNDEKHSSLIPLFFLKGGKLQTNPTIYVHIAAEFRLFSQT